MSLIYGKDEYLEKLQDTIWVICDEYCWALPAHVNPENGCDTTFLDLFASETGFALSEIYYLLGDKLNPLLKDRMKYECALNDQVTVQGKYELQGNDKILVCTPESKNSINRYIIKSLTADELVLAGNAENQNVVLHFKPH